MWGAGMANKLARLIELIQKMPEDCVENALNYVTGIVEEVEKEKAKKEPEPPCPHCDSKSVRNGQSKWGQRFLCSACGKTFGRRAGSAMKSSHYGEAVWKQVIRDTIDGVSLDATASALKVSHSTAFNMRHKILLAIDTAEQAEPTRLSGVCELDDTYVLESFKGRKLPSDFWRKPRKHGAVAQKRGLSDEYVAICTAIGRDGSAVAKTVNRATPSKDEVLAVYADKIAGDALLLCDGAKSFAALGEVTGCPVVDVFEDGRQPGFYHINTANNFHSFIKERYNQYRGVATKYLNRYNGLFARLYRGGENQVDEIYKMLCRGLNSKHRTVKDVKNLDLLWV